MRHRVSGVAAAAALGVLLIAGCTAPAPPAPAQDVGLVPVAALPADPADAAWNAVPEFSTKLLLQDMVEPRLLKPTTAVVRVRALTCGSEAAFRIEWLDSTDDNLPGAARFCDACAVQVPAKADPSVPAPQMGEAGKTVEITYWSAAWQAMVNGRQDVIQSFYPNASVDHYPFDAASLKKDSAEQREMAARYAPARALGNAMAGPRTSPVQDLIAEGPGALAPAPQTSSRGGGKRTADGWAVVLIRRLPVGFSERTGSQVAFAIWDGSHEEAGARKMRSAWIPLIVREK
jgi:DMSO reductase family type II enzyme heme b subunit